MKTILELIDEFYFEVKQLEIQRSRVEGLLSLIQNERGKYKKFNPYGAALKGTVEMVNAMNTVELIDDLDKCISLLEHYLKLGNFKVFIVTKQKNIREQTRFDNIKKKLEVLFEPPVS